MQDGQDDRAEQQERERRDRLTVALNNLSPAFPRIREAGLLVLTHRDARQTAKTVIELLEGRYELPPSFQQMDARIQYFQNKLGLPAREAYFATEADWLATGKFTAAPAPERRDVDMLIRRINDFAPK